MKPWWCILLAVANQASAKVSLCPALRSQREENSLLYGYPAEALLPSVLADNPHAKFRNCSGRNLVWPTDVQHLCSLDTSLCAVTKQNVQTAIGVADWPQYSEALYRLQQAITHDTPHEMNVFVLGGSMTRGSTTYSACICQKNVDSTCPELMERSEETDCSWVTMLSRWLEKDIAQDNITITVHNLARSGAASHFMADIVADVLRLVAHTTTLSANDLVIVDHSVNDISVYAEELQMGFESLIRRLLHLTADGARPTIVVLEQHPIGTRRENVTRELQGSGDYAVIYREVCRHYGVLLWSLREVTWSHLDFTAEGAINSTTPVEKQVVIDGVQQVRMYQYPADVEQHPPWWRHLFVADVVADSMLHVMSLVSGAAPGLYTRAATTPEPYVVPPPLHNLTSSSQSLCDASQPFLVDVHAKTEHRPVNVTAYETDRAVVSKVGWREYIDFHDTPGFIINSLSDPEQNHLTFPLAEREHYHKLVIKMVHLKSYSGMGLVGVKMCGEYVIRDIDALYHDYETYKFSLPTESIFKLRKGTSERCVAAAAENRTLQIVYYGAKNDEFASVRQQHHHKFKLLSVELCTPVENE